MMRVGANTRMALRLALRAAMLAGVLLTTSGCFFTISLWEWANQAPESAPVGVVSDAQGDQVIFRFRHAHGVPNAHQAMHVPKGWQSQPSQPSPLDPRVIELTQRIAPHALTPQENQQFLGTLPARIFRLSPRAVIGPAPPPAMAAGGTAYGFLRRYVHGQLVDEVYGYDPARGRWIRLGSVLAFSGSPGRVVVAILLTPFTLVLDIGGIIFWLAAISQPRVALAPEQSQPVVRVREDSILVPLRYSTGARPPPLLAFSSSGA